MLERERADCASHYKDNDEERGKGRGAKPVVSGVQRSSATTRWRASTLKVVPNESGATRWIWAVKDHVGIGLIGHDSVACLDAEGRAQRAWRHSMDLGSKRLEIEPRLAGGPTEMDSTVGHATQGLACLSGTGP